MAILGADFGLNPNFRNFYFFILRNLSSGSSIFRKSAARTFRSPFCTANWHVGLTSKLVQVSTFSRFRKPLRKLETLSFRVVLRQSIDSFSCQAIANALRVNQTIKSVNLHGNQIGDEGLKAPQLVRAVKVSG